MEIDESGLKKAFNLIGENLKAIDAS